MTENEAAAAVAAWVEATLSDLAVVYPYQTAQRGALPDAMVDVQSKTIDRGDERFPHRNIQQAWMRIFTVQASLMVDSPSEAAADQQETEQLRGFGADLEASALADATLGGSLPQSPMPSLVSPVMVFDYELPFIQYPDGTRGRQMVATFIVADLMPEGGK